MPSDPDPMEGFFTMMIAILVIAAAAGVIGWIVEWIRY